MNVSKLFYREAPEMVKRYGTMKGNDQHYSHIICTIENLVIDLSKMTYYTQKVKNISIS